MYVLSPPGLYLGHFKREELVNSVLGETSSSEVILSNNEQYVIVLGIYSNKYKIKKYGISHLSKLNDIKIIL